MDFTDRNSPPTEWCDWWTEVHRAGDTVYYGWVPEHLTALPDDPNPWFWHWCPTVNGGEGRWIAQDAPEHTLVSREPLHLEPSILWPCCGTHGWMRNGTWADA